MSSQRGGRTARPFPRRRPGIKRRAPTLRASVHRRLVQDLVRPPLPPVVRPQAARDRARTAANGGPPATPVVTQRHHRSLLATLPAGSPLTHDIVAGLTTLRLLDRWHFRGAGDASDLLPVRMAVEQVPCGSPFGPPLAAAVERVAPLLEGDTIQSDAQVTAARADIAGSLEAYALELEIAGLAGAARDAYRMMRALAESVVAYDGARGDALAERAGFGWARAALADGAIEGADRLYASLRMDAERAGHAARQAEATLGLAAVREASGRLGDAERLVGDALAALGFPGTTGDTGRCLVVIAQRALARMRMRRDDWAGCARALSTAFRFSEAGEAQDLLLAELGGSLVQVGAVDAAQQVLECLATTGRAAAVRRVVDQALLGLYAQRRMLPAFERCRRRLLARAVRPGTRGEALLAVATGYEMLGEIRLAARWYHRARVHARAHEMESLEEAAMTGLRGAGVALARLAAAIGGPADSARAPATAARDVAWQLRVVKQADLPRGAAADGEWGEIARTIVAQRARRPA